MSALWVCYHILCPHFLQMQNMRYQHDLSKVMYLVGEGEKLIQLGAPPLPLLPSFTQLVPTAGKTARSIHSSDVESVASCAFPKRGSTFEAGGNTTAK